MLAHGEDPNFGPYSQTIRRGVDFILKKQGSNGYIGMSMYNHGFGTLALAESYGSLDDARIGPALKKAVNLILTSQAANPHGGWRYSPESTDADTTVSGAQMVAIFAARNAGIEIPDKAVKRGLAYYKSAQTPDGGMGYSGPGGPNSARTAIGALVFALAREKDDPSFQSAMKYLRQTGFDPDGSYPMYYEYYAAQAFFHGDMEVWKKWNKNNFDALRLSQDESGGWEGGNGPTFSTAAALLSLAVNYRLVPIYER
ncbi:MAG: prenyltransferase/squalene oxidase repeat-containing protein [Kiritimatiellia bacterium]